MATFKDGINGPFRGKIGGVVGYQWKDKWVMRSLPRPVKNRKWSEAQLASQAKMRLMQNFLSIHKEFVRRGFAMVPETSRMNAYNAAMSYNRKWAIQGDYPDYELNYEAVAFSMGGLEMAGNIQVKQSSTKLKVTWDPDCKENGRFDDQLMLLIAYDGQSNTEGIISGAKREAGADFYDIKGLPNGTDLHIYAAFISDDRKEVSDSMYLGIETYLE